MPYQPSKPSQPSYKKLITYQQSAWVRLLTKEFIKRFLHPIKDQRLIDQMTGSGRSGKQNVAEGGKRKGLKDYIEFLTFSRASLEELLEDFKDVAFDRGVKVWGKEDRRLIGLRWWIGQAPPSSPSKPYLPSSFEYSVNLMVDLIIKTNYLLDRQIASLEDKFIKEGGYTENLAKKRREFRGF